MNTNPIGARYVAPDNLAREPLYFGSGERTLFGWLHRPDGAIAGGVGLVICKPFGYEAICSHRTVRAVVEEATGLGMPCLRFDYLGTGDSEDIDPDADQLDVWVRDVVAAVSELRRATGVARVCLLGFRLGALIATLAAAQCETVGALALVAPVISGRRYLNELRVTQLVSLAAMNTSQSSSDPDAGQRAPHTGSIEAAGYLLSAATVAKLARIDLATLGTLHASQMLIIDRDDLPTARAWVDTARRLGPQVQYQTSPGYVGILRSPQFAVVPRTMVATLRDWLVRFESARPERSDGVETTKASPRAAVPPTTTLLLPGDGSAPEMRLRERPLWFGADGAVFGIVTEPRSNEIRRRAVILINAGADNHTGASRMHVLFARQWARRGYVVLRMDLAGLGDSDTRPGRPDDEVFPPAALDDIRAAIELMRSQYSVGEVTLAGLCSGAYHALRAAVAGQPVNRILMVNPQNFFWDYSTTLEDVQLADVVRNPAVYRERVLSATAWRRVFAGKVNVWRIVQIHFQRLLLTLESTLRDLARRLRIRLPRDVGWELEEIDSRGVRTVMVFARGEPGVDLLRLQGGLSVKRLGSRCRIHVIDSADHTFTRSGPRAQLAEILSDELFARITTSAAGTGFRELHGS